MIVNSIENVNIPLVPLLNPSRPELITYLSTIEYGLFKSAFRALTSCALPLSKFNEKEDEEEDAERPSRGAVEPAEPQLLIKTRIRSNI
jgi:hypothetical protein